MICDRCYKEYDEPSDNQYLAFEVTVITCENREKYNLCPECNNKLVNWLTNEGGKHEENESGD